MEDSFFVYLEQLSLMLFFSGYALTYLLIRSLAETAVSKKIFRYDLSDLLPYAYALTGVLFLGLQLKNLYPDYSIAQIKLAVHTPLLTGWGLLTLLFFLPFFAQKPVFSFLHSLIFFLFLMREIYLSAFRNTDEAVLKNYMHIYSYSLLINFAAFILVSGVFFLFRSLKKS